MRISFTQKLFEMSWVRGPAGEILHRDSVSRLERDIRKRVGS